MVARSLNNCGVAAMEWAIPLASCTCIVCLLHVKLRDAIEDLAVNGRRRLR